MEAAQRAELLLLGIVFGSVLVAWASGVGAVVVVVCVGSDLGA
jgi:hypothetical protein